MLSERLAVTSAHAPERVVGMLSEDVNLTNLEALIAGCWITAERETAAEVLEEHSRPATCPLLAMDIWKVPYGVSLEPFSSNHSVFTQRYTKASEWDPRKL